MFFQKVFAGAPATRVPMATSSMWSPQYFGLGLFGVGAPVQLDKQHGFKSSLGLIRDQSYRCSALLHVVCQLHEQTAWKSDFLLIL